MPRFEFESPGVAAAGALKQFLVEQEFLKRQAMLDEMARQREARLLKSADANIANMQANTASLIEQRDAAIKERKNADFMKRYNTLGVGGKMSPAMQKEAEALGLEHLYSQGPPTTQVVAPGTPMTGAAGEIPSRRAVNVVPGVVQATGTPEGRAAAAKQAAMDTLMANPNIPEEAKDMVRAGVLDGAALVKYLNPEDTDTRSLTLRANEAHAKGDMAEYKRLLDVIKATGQADDRPFALRRIETIGPDGKPVQMFVEAREGSSYAAGPTSTERDRQASIGRSKAVLDSIAELSEKINTGEGLLAKITGEAEKLAAKANYDDDVAEYQALVSGFTPLVARAVGHTGVLTEQDVQSVREMFPKPGDSKTLRDRKIKRILTVIGAMGSGAPAQAAPGAQPAPVAPAAPAAGGTSFVRDPKTGKLVRQ